MRRSKCLALAMCCVFFAGMPAKAMQDSPAATEKLERFRKEIEAIVKKYGLENKLDEEGKVGKLLRAEMSDQNFVDFFNCVIDCVNEKNKRSKKIRELSNDIIKRPDLKKKLDKLVKLDEKVEFLKKELGAKRVADLFYHVKKKIDYKLAIPKILGEKVVDEMLAVTNMSDGEKKFIKDNVNFYLCPVVFDREVSLKIYGFLKSYNFLKSYKRNPLIIQNFSAHTPDELRREIDDNKVACVCFFSGQLRNGRDYYSEEYNIKPLNILKKVNGKFVLADTSNEDDDNMSKNYLVGKFFENVDKRSGFWSYDDTSSEDDDDFG